MPSSRISGVRRPLMWSAFPLVAAIALGFGGCTHVAGNFPPASLKPANVKARFIGEGFQLLAGTSLRLDKVKAELKEILAKHAGTAAGREAEYIISQL